MADEKAAVPKFASFRPKQPAQAVLSPDDVALKPKGDDDRKSRRKHRSRSRSRSHERRRDHRDDDRRHRHRSRSRIKDEHRDRDRREKKPKSSFDTKTLALIDEEAIRKELFDNASELYRIDTKGDADNLRYRKLHSYSIPGYRRIGYGRVLGASLDQKIDRSYPEDKGIVLIAVEREGRAPRSLFQKKSRTEERKLRLVRPAELDVSSYEHDLDFVALPRSRKRKRGEEEPRPQDGEVDYRSIEGKAKPSQQPQDSDLEYASSSDSDADAEDEGRAARLRSAELTKRTRDQPQDLDAWLELIDHQREVLGFSQAELSHAKARTLADIRISIYEEALSVVKNPDARAKLTLGMLDEGAKLWEAKTLSKKWGGALKTFSSNTAIWTSYLNFIQTSHAEFRYEHVREEYIKCLSILSGTLQKERGTDEGKKTSRLLVYVFLRLTSMMHDAGYHEFAIALWQAVLEMTFFRPEEKVQSLEESFEAFWEAEHPRIGEIDSLGWNHDAPDQDNIPEPIVLELPKVDGARRLFSRFANAEREAMQELSMPGRTADEAGEDDPYHTVLFSDLTTVLFPHMLLLEDERDLILAFLKFSNLPPLPHPDGQNPRAWWTDPMLSQREVPNVQISHYQTDTDGLFSIAFAVVKHKGFEWSSRVLASLVKACPKDDVLAEYHIAFEFHIDPANAAKIAKRLLKTRSSSLRLYNAYAILESRIKDVDAGSKIFSTALSMSSSFDDEQQRLKILLYRTWIWEALMTGDTSTATGILLTLGGDVKQAEHASFSPAAELRVTRWLEEGRDAMLSASEGRLAVLHMELLALFSYFRNVRSVEAALSIYDLSDALLTSRGLARSVGHEILSQAKAQLIRYHLKHIQLYKPALLRATLADSIATFPNNTILLETYQDLGPALDFLAPTTLTNDIVINPANGTMIGFSWALSVAHHRSVEMGGTSHAARALFERAVSPSSPCMHNVHIWTHYLKFEVDTQKDIAKARDVFMRGLKELPWSKGWILLGLEKLGDVLGWEEGVKVWQVLGEKEMRVIVDIEGVIEDEWDRRRAIDG